ncbi:class I SAM-dependent methyltransferase [Hasllibacter sp. MH4015]|uniref:class I SAM-dependent methyltransferase n=1 Tax=Hasllibacter sp. MH4015 TaxID=2854029 RepID=UPI001CD64D8E|nr:class I SAM-dependent methyltransferase [Hasllibacter sp. MH4015]
MAAKTDDYMAMKRAGYYSRATIGARHVMDGAVGLILDALDRQPPRHNDIFTMTDMGCADGGTSLGLVGDVLGRVRDHEPDILLRMVYADLPRTDFSTLFQIVHGMTEMESYAGRFSDLHIHASATSFHKQIVPAGTLDLGFSATASHYIADVPCDIPDHLHMVRAEGDVRAAFQAQGARDWENFLMMRARELRSGGVLALFNFGIDENGYWLGDTGGVSMHDTFAELWAEMVKDGTITQAEFEATNFPQVYRTVEEFRAPLDGGPVADAGLRLEHLETRVVPCPFAAAFADHGDAARFARDYVPTLRSWSEPVFLKGLDSTRPTEERAAIVDAFYDRYVARVAEHPDGHAMDYVHCYMICRKA